LIIGPNQWVRPLADERLLRSIQEGVDDELLARYLQIALASLTYEGELYGLPLSLDTSALYRNNDLASETPATLEMLLSEASPTKPVAISTNFYDAFWGLQTFGATLSSVGGQPVFDPNGYVNWLTWLDTARRTPGVLTESDRTVLRDLFIQGEAAYYVGKASDLEPIVSEMGDERVKTLPLPGGPNGSASPLLETSAFLFSAMSSQRQARLAQEFARFATNGEQSLDAMRLANEVPANATVRINEGIYPAIATFAAQARTATPVVNDALIEQMLGALAEQHERAMGGLTSPSQAASTVSERLTALGAGVAQATSSFCASSGAINVGYDAEAYTRTTTAAFEELVRRFRFFCPTVQVNLRPMTLAQATAALTTTQTLTDAVHLFIAPQSWLLPLAEQGALADLNTLMDSSFLQRFVPQAVESMRVDGAPLAAPLFIDAPALYYNRSLVSDPAATLADLLVQSDAGSPVVLDAAFVPAFWGVPAFGGKLFDAERRVVLDQGGFADWLTWLRDARDNHSVDLIFDGAVARRLFAQGESVYFVGGSRHIGDLQTLLGPDRLGITTLPAGPAASGAPFINVSGLMAANYLPVEKRAAVTDFIRYATDADRQTLLMNRANVAPANVAARAADNPLISVFLRQVQTSTVMPNTYAMETLLAASEGVYGDVLLEGGDPTAVVSEFVQRVNEANGLPPLAAKEPPPSDGMQASPTLTATQTVTATTP
jgi:maltose-binding protein MalE